MQNTSRVVRPSGEKFARAARERSCTAHARHVDCTLLVSTVVGSASLITFVWLAQMASALEELVARIKERANPDAYCVLCVAASRTRD